MILYFDCFSGISGDMALGALVDLGVPLDELRAGLAAIDMGGYRLEGTREARQGLAGTRVQVIVDPSIPQPERHPSDVAGLIEDSGLSSGVKARAVAVFARLARVESAVHGVPLDQVHFHEVGAVDSIVDIVGVALGLESLAVDQVYASSLPLGHGRVQTSHGLLPLPAPATLQLLADVGAPTRPVEVEAELVTPTGAALLAEFARFEPWPPMSLDRVGCGFGTRHLPWPNVLRVWLARPIEATGAVLEEVAVLESNIDDMTPEQAGYVLDSLLAGGALDAFFTPAQMKKNRPGFVLGVIATPASVSALAQLVLRETSTLGVRIRTTTRLVAPRSIEEVQTEFGPMRVKAKRLGGERFVVPEYEDAARVAREHGVPLFEVYRRVEAASRSQD